MKTLVAVAASLLLAMPVFASGATHHAKKYPVSMKQAEKTALAKEPGKIKSKELEHENGKDIYSFDIRTASSINELNVDAHTGAIIEDKVESQAAEAQEKQQDAAAPQR